MSVEWGRKDQSDEAIETILAAAEKAFVERGVSAAGMSEIAERAGCSRGTLYRYFKNRHELHLAYVERTSNRIQRAALECVQGIDDPRERLVEFVLFSIRQVRDDPATAAWFSASAGGLAARMARSTEVVEIFTRSFLPEALTTHEARREDVLRNRWLVRVIVSLLSDPGENSAEEREMLERFVVPVILSDVVEGA